MSRQWKIRVPASTANLGPGFDSIGMALGRYLTLHVKQSEEWFFEGLGEDLQGLPSGKENLIYIIAEWVAEKYEAELPAAYVTMESDIPLSRGFGSSATAIVAGIELVNELCGLQLTKEEKAHLASLYEGHPDNVVPSIYGGLVIGSQFEEETHVVHAGVPTVDLVAVIPSYELSTKESRDTLPEGFTYKAAVSASSVSNVLTAAIMQDNWELAGRLMKKDLFHRPYRLPSIPEWQRAELLVEELPVYGATLSGAGPIILFFVPKGKGKEVLLQIRSQYPGQAVEQVDVDAFGSSVEVLEAACTAKK
ncbi:homoserine kinase [Alkalicoccus saliphilus]|jgi:homoserine kinase|uniref:Homoserine kinase n=1 Tax=Alkalicoccus saliphilus TaxID=200989 RepID=A0A2T4U3H6_9BACI|nr:homoserine kinase [Alkalicoccus saliphilus]PTL37947.1 homoserine kinase [Alkalicoccus saliphilus]